jgi:cell division protein FtsB
MKEMLLQLPTDMLGEDTSFKVFLFFIIIVLLIAISFLYKKVDVLQVSVTALQGKHTEDLIDMLEKSNARVTAFEKMITDRSINDREMIRSFISQEVSVVAKEIEKIRETRVKLITDIEAIKSKTCPK